MMQPQPPEPVRLSTLLQGEFIVPARLDRTLSGIQIDSRRVRPGDLFIACRGLHADGRNYIPGAIASGAAAVLVEADDVWSRVREEAKVPLVPVIDLPRKLCKVAARFHGEPAHKLRLIGITGTNGKTTCCQLIAQALAALGYRCGVIGTLGHGMLDATPDTDRDGPSTTPDALRLQQLLSDMLAAQGDTVVMEVSSHGLDQYRVDVNEFAAAVFTNLTRDHLDYHGSMAAYGETKRRLFTGSRLQVAVFNQDDPFSAEITSKLPASVQAFGWSLHNSRAAIHARSLQFTAAGLEFELVTPWGSGLVHSSLLGSFNAANLLSVVATVLACESGKPDFDPARIILAVSALVPVRGRMQLLRGFPVSVVVDYAHSPDGLDSALRALREHFRGMLCCVFGCGGDRDQGKRPEMAAIAGRYADTVIVTDDNPRNEESGTIIGQILAGFDVAQRNRVLVEADRAKAIAAAIAVAEPGSVVLVAGKGHEEYQEISGVKHPFSDVAQALACLERRFGNATGATV